MKHGLRQVLCLGCCLLCSVILFGADESSEKHALLSDTLTPKKWYSFIVAGREYSEHGTLAKIISIDKDWVKVEFFEVGPRPQGWINLNQVGAIKGLSKEETQSIGES